MLGAWTSTGATRCASSWALTLASGLATPLAARGPVLPVLLLASVGLLLSAVARVFGLREAGAWRTRRLDLVVGLGLLVAAGLAVLWRSAPLRVIAWVLAGALLVSGLVTTGRALAGRLLAGERWSGLLGGAASVLAGLLVLVWPRLSLAVLALVLGAWLVLGGLLLLLRPGPARRRLPALRAALALLLTLALAAGTVWLHRLDPREEPDAFYTPPLAVPAEPGRIVRAEPYPSERVPAGLRGWRILYTSTDGAGEPTVVSGTVLAPQGEGPWPVISVAHGTTGVIPRCAPSLADDPFGGGAAEAVRAAVDEGWVAVTSDYLGLGTRGPHPYLVGPDAARNVLDATRAAGELEGLDLEPRTVVWGHSQGGHGALWTGAVAPSYSPEIELLGVAALAPAADLVPLAQGVRATTGGKLVSAYIAASWSEHYDLGLRSLVTPGYVGVVERVAGTASTGRTRWAPSRSRAS